MIPAHGRSNRMGEDKLWADVLGRPLLQVTLGAVAAIRELFDEIVVVAPRPRWGEVMGLARREGFTDIVLAGGGERRQDSVRAGINACSQLSHVVVHDAARPLCPAGLFRSVLAAAVEHGAATAAVPQVDTVKRVGDGVVTGTPDRGELMAIQTPQAFETPLIITAHEIALDESFDADDDCALVERLGHEVRIVKGDPRAFKVTRPQDLLLLRTMLQARGSRAAARSGAG